MSKPSRELLEPPSEPSFPDFLLLGCKELEAKQKGNPIQKPFITSVPRSKVLEKAKILADEMVKANEQLAIDVQVKPREEIEIDAHTGNEKEYIQIDLLLGVADLNTDAAVAAAEAAMSSIQSTTRTVACSSSSEEEEEDESDASDNEGQNSSVKSDENVRKAYDKEPQKKRQKIEEIN